MARMARWTPQPSVVSSSDTSRKDASTATVPAVTSTAAPIPSTAKLNRGVSRAVSSSSCTRSTRAERRSAECVHEVGKGFSAALSVD